MITDQFAFLNDLEYVPAEDVQDDQDDDELPVVDVDDFDFDDDSGVDPYED